MKRFVAAAAVLAATSVSAEVRVGALIGDHMVVQQRKPVRLWGTAAANESVRVSLAGRQAATRADGAGRWQVTLRALPASGPHVLTIEGKNRLTFADVWGGEVWVASGQSNMDFPSRRATRRRRQPPRAAPGCGCSRS
jgi:sialate O-acetylesterase